MTLFRTIVYFLILIFLPVIYTVNAEGVFNIDPESEIEIGKKTDREIVHAYGLVNNKKIQNYVNRIGQKIVKSVDNPIFEYHFKVLDSQDVNAFALPGGYIYITRGILAFIGSEAELAVILGHEIGHVTSHHGVKQLQKMQGSILLTLLGLLASANAQDASAWAITTTTLSQHILSGYGREAERQSDHLSIVYTHDAGYDPRVISLFFRKLKAMERFGGRSYHGFLASHPDTIERIISSEGKADSIVKEKDKPIINKDEFLEIINGLSYGKSVGKISKKTDYIIQIYEVQKEEKLKKIVTNVTGSPENAIEVAMINGIRMNSIVKIGEKIKLIVSRNNKYLKE